jgi:C-terminal processing protease CtpA/Prc
MLARSLKFILQCLACWLAYQASSSAAPADTLLDVARLWRDIHYVHPALVDGSAHWESALAQHMPAMAAARSDTELLQGLRPMLRTLNDSSLRIWTEQDDALVDWPADRPLLEWVRPGTALLHLHAGRAVQEEKWQAALAGLRTARTRKLIVDLRAVSWHDADLSMRLRQLAAACIASPLLLPAEQYRFSAAARPSGDLDSQDIHGGLITLETVRIFPAAAAQRIPMAFLVNTSTPVPKVALALQHQGQARIIAEEDALRSYAEPIMRHNVGPRIRVEFAAGHLIFPDGVAAYTPDQSLKPDRRTGPSSTAIRIAQQLLDRPWRRPTPRMKVPSLPVAAARETYDETRMPAPGWRMLAAVKLWATIDRQHPARYLLGDSWDAALTEALESTLHAETELQYGLAVQTLAARAGDSHVNVWSRALNTYWGRADLGIQLAKVEGRVIVTGLDSAVADAKRTLAAGDEIVAVDGRDVASRLADFDKTISSSTAAGATRSALRRLLRGSEEQAAVLTVASAQGKREVVLHRQRYDEDPPERPTTEVVRRLDGNYAYVDLDRLERDAVPAMFTAIADTGGVIFDLRGYPRATAWAIAPRLNVNGAQYGPVAHAPFVSGHPMAPLGLDYPQFLRPASEPIYKGKVVVLIDERTMSQAEHTVLMFEAAAPVTLIGSASSGTNGDLRHISLPGKIAVSYSGYEITRADGTRLQRIGLQPHIAVTPTVAGIRARRDEVLERAIQFLREEH